MSIRSTEYMLAKGMGIARGGSSSIMQRVAICAVAISVAVMIISVAVVSGFKMEIISKVEAFVSHYEVVSANSSSSYDNVAISKNEPFVEKLMQSGYVKQISPYTLKAGVMSHEDAIQGVLLKGVDSLYDMNFFKEYLTHGEIPDFKGERKKEIVISSTLARNMKAGVGDKLRIMFMDTPIRRDIFSISAIYDTSLAEFDKATAIVDMRNVQRLNDWGEDSVTGYELLTDNFTTSEQNIGYIEDIIYDNETSEHPLLLESMRQKYTAIFEWLALQDLNIVIITIIMLIVAIFNMVAMMLIILIERTSTIGILKSIGMTNASLQRVFIYRSIPIVVQGIIWGNLSSGLLCYIQKTFGILKLNEAGYFLTVVPINFDWGTIALINILAVVVIILSQALPTLVISKISPHKAIKYE